MFVELIDLLRCPNPHADSWLVAAAVRTVGRHVVDGTLGCPVCTAEFPIREAVADFGGALDAGVSAEPPPGDDGERAMRLAALLGLTTTGATVVLGGDAGGANGMVAALLAEMAGARVLLLDAPPAPLVDQISAIRGGGGLPVAASSVRGVVLDGRTADAARLDAAVRAIVPGGRLVAPASVPLPVGVAELASDAWQWVAERYATPAASAPVPLVRRR